MTLEQKCVLIMYNNVYSLLYNSREPTTHMIVIIRDVVCVAMTLVATLVMINDIMQCTLSVQGYF